jgi:hypothetical protein
MGQEGRGLQYVVRVTLILRPIVREAIRHDCSPSAININLRHRRGACRSAGASDHHVDVQTVHTHNKNYYYYQAVGTISPTEYQPRVRHADGLLSRPLRLDDPLERSFGLVEPPRLDLALEQLVQLSSRQTRRH